MLTSMLVRSELGAALEGQGKRLLALSGGSPALLESSGGASERCTPLIRAPVVIRQCQR